MQRTYHQFTDVELRAFFRYLCRWLKEPANLDKCPPLTSDDVSQADNLFTVFDEALEITLTGHVRQIDTLDKNDARKDIIKWLENKFRPYIWGRTRTLDDKDFLDMGYHPHAKQSHDTSTQLPTPILTLEIEGHYGIRLYPCKAHLQKGKPEQAHICLIQERITRKGGAPLLDAAHDEDQRQATQIHDAIRQQGHSLPPSVETDWETIAIVTSVNTGIRFRYNEAAANTEHNYRALWGNHHGYSLWSNTVSTIIY